MRSAAVTPLHRLHDFLQRRDIRAVSRENLVAQRHSALGNHQPDADLFAVGPMVARVAALGQRIAVGLALEIRAGHVVQQQVVLDAEQLAQAVLQEGFQRFFMRQNRVQRAIETLLVDLLGRNAQEIDQRALGVKMLGDVQFARRLAEAAEDQHQGHQRPGDFFAAVGKRAVEKVLQAQLLDKLQSQPRPAEVAAVFHAHAFDIDFDPVGPRVVEELFLAGFRVAFGGVLDAQPMRFIELPEIGDDALSRPALGAIRLHQRPVGVSLSVLPAITRANEHARIVALDRLDPTSRSSLQRPKQRRRTNSSSCRNDLQQETPPSCGRQI